MKQNNIQQTLDKAERECFNAGLRLTTKRRQVLKILLQTQEPLSAYEIAEQFKTTTGNSLSAMSAYRMLDFLLEAGLVHKLDTTNQYLACAHIICEHPHQIPQFLICDNCHRVEEVGVDKPLLDELKASIARTGFELLNQQLELHGICADCKKPAQG